MTVGVYAGSFDPITYGHLSVVSQASKAFDQLVVAIGINSSKKGLFSTDERVGFIRAAVLSYSNIRVVTFNGLLVQYCQSLMERSEKVVIVRGLRAVSDFEQEMAIANVNLHIDPNIPTVFFPTAAEHAFVSSSSAKEMARYAGTAKALREYVPADVVEALIERLGPTQAIIDFPGGSSTPSENQDCSEPECSPEPDALPEFS